MYVSARMFGHQWEHCRTLLWDCACGFWGLGPCMCEWTLIILSHCIVLSGGSRIPISVGDSQQKSCRWIEGCLYLRLVGAPSAFMWWILASGPLRGGSGGQMAMQENPQRCVVGVTGSSQKSWCFLDKRSDNQVLPHEKPLRIGGTSPGGAGSSMWHS